MTAATDTPTDALPWERRSSMDLEKAFAQTVVAFLNPKRAWETTPESGGYGGPLLFAGLCGAIGALFTATYDVILFQWMLHRNPGLRSGKIPWLTGKALLPLSKLNIVISPVVNGVLVALFTFVLATTIHAGVLLVGARKSSRSRFEGSFRVAAYAAAGLVGQVVPVLGSLIAFVWWLVLAVTGVARMHRTSIGKALAALVLSFAIVLVVMFAFTSRH